MLKNTFKKTDTVDIKKMYHHAYGIIAPEDKKPEQVIFRCTKLQAEYMDSFPLHHSQTIVEKTNTHVTFELTIQITYDFIQELLSFGKEIEIVTPTKLRNKVKEIITAALKLYE